MAYISKRKALKALKQTIVRGQTILANDRGTEASGRWRRFTKDLLKEVLTETSELYLRFCGVRFGLQEISFGPETQERKDAALKAEYAGIGRAIEVLEECVRQIEEHGLIAERTQRHPLWDKLWIPLSLAVVAAVLSMLAAPVRDILGISSNGGEQLTEEQREMQCKQLKVIFENRCKELEADFRAGRDSVKSVLQRRNPRGGNYKHTREYLGYCSRATIRWNNTIDSFTVAFEAADCDTTTMRYKRTRLK